MSFIKDKELLYYILEAVEHVYIHVQSSCSEFTKERAIIFEIITIGEAVKNLSKAIKEEHDYIPWQLIADSRNKMVHNYEDIASRIVTDIVERHLPELRKNIETIIRKEEGN